MTELFATNLSIITKRWPIVAAALQSQSIEHLDAFLVTGRNQTISVNGIQLSSRHDRIAEAQLFISTLPLDATQVTVYGVGMGDVPSLLIDNPQYQTINVCILNLAVFALLISYTDQSEWLSHPQVELLENLSQTVNFPNIAITPDLSLVSDENATLRDLLIFEKCIEFSNKKHQIDYPKLQIRFEENSIFLRTDPSAELLKSKYNKKSAFIIGSGPSLEKKYNYLKKWQLKNESEKPLIISVDTAFKALESQNIFPDIVISIDKNITNEHFPTYIPDNIKLVYFPTTSPSVIRSWPGPRFNAYSKGGIYDNFNFKNPKIRLYTNGSVIHPAIDLAVSLDIRDITLFGCDFSYPNNKTHAYWEDGQLGPTSKNAKHWVINGYGKRVPTDLNFRGYLRSLESYIKTKPSVKFYQSSLDGAYIQGTHFKECS
ncbi:MULTISPECIES: motility associated factor glycosyltransferase family protein [Shewanella]|uniref:motility associated factor glycosyltransferase family protein n=1 Tax=Shewanella TaxID=22 RepID=UPI000B4A00FA|nr:MULTISPECIES: 6-hydroxymethylpterin diphosphokinase MptE-like protein [unclassified Shewanella]QYJ72731.1 DUF115 domain-containing protein [Shewanella sp. FJAT-51649]